MSEFDSDVLHSRGVCEEGNDDKLEHAKLKESKLSKMVEAYRTILEVRPSGRIVDSLTGL